MRVSSRLAFSWVFFRVLVTCLGILLCFVPTSAEAQSAATGMVSGQACDSPRAIVAAARVQLLDISTDITLPTLSHDAGRTPPPISHTNRFGYALGKPADSQGSFRARLTSSLVQLG